MLTRAVAILRNLGASYFLPLLPSCVNTVTQAEKPSHASFFLYISLSQQVWNEISAEYKKVSAV